MVEATKLQVLYNFFLLGIKNLSQFTEEKSTWVLDKYLKCPQAQMVKARNLKLWQVNKGFEVTNLCWEDFPVYYKRWGGGGGGKKKKEKERKHVKIQAHR